MRNRGQQDGGAWCGTERNKTERVGKKMWTDSETETETEIGMTRHGGMDTTTTTRADTKTDDSRR